MWVILKLWCGVSLVSFQSKIFMTLLAMSATHVALKSDEKVKMLMPIHNFSPNMYAYQICG